MKHRDKEYWDARRLPGITADDAWKELTAVFGASPITAGSMTTKGTRIHVRIETQERVDHCLYKGWDGRKLSDKFKKDPADFLQPRAERIGFIVECLADPDEVRQETKHPQYVFYILRISGDELFIVLISKPSGPAADLISYWEVDLNNYDHRWEWKSLRDRTEERKKRPKARKKKKEPSQANSKS